MRDLLDEPAAPFVDAGVPSMTDETPTRLGARGSERLERVYCIAETPSK